MFFGDPTFLLAIPALILAFYAQARVKGAYRKYSQVFAASRLTGAQAAYQLLQAAGAGSVTIEKQPGQLTDHYDPRKKVLRLSEGVHDSTSIAALGIAAHEAGHAIQHHTQYGPMGLRSIIYPVANLGLDPGLPALLHRVLLRRQDLDRLHGHRHPAFRRGRRVHRRHPARRIRRLEEGRGPARGAPLPQRGRARRGQEGPERRGPDLCRLDRHGRLPAHPDARPALLPRLRRGGGCFHPLPCYASPLVA
ncbi:MAG: zinc metallopeptidase [Desulfomicrobium escambiense]|nr:zinc metallopeptidase [Desulfomicrobium escambiense]